MITKSLQRIFILMVLFISGCATPTYEVITCTPLQADIYWGKTKSELEKTGYETPHSRSISGSSWENWCYQVKKDGYHDSEVICKQKDQYRNLDFYLVTLKTTINSEPPGATIYWGPSPQQLIETKYVTPQTITVKDVTNGASWQDWYYQVKKKGYDYSEVAFLPRQSSDREVYFRLKSTAKAGVVYDSRAIVRQKESSPNEYAVSGTQVTIAWEDHSGDELGFKIERKTGSDGLYREIATVGENVTNFTDIGLQPGTTYYYRVRAYNSNGHSTYSQPIAVKSSTH